MIIMIISLTSGYFVFPLKKGTKMNFIGYSKVCFQHVNSMNSEVLLLLDFHAIKSKTPKIMFARTDTSTPIPRRIKFQAVSEITKAV
jgi:hypothetical protein